ncbi:hypothetical protein B0H19DRAFT_1338446 [Mycena capillaripes]|nr:hypothetical protein B0H19DRAFT_1338446 [Mycena capillaripes]
MPFEALGDDILLKVLALCNVYYTALSASQGVLDLSPARELESCSTAALVQYVKRGVVGPAAWHPGSSSPTTPHRQLTFDGGLGGEDLIDMHLLPGGRYVLLQTREHLHIHETAGGGRIWKYAVFYAYSSSLWITRAHHISVQELDLVRGQSSEIFSLDLPTGLERWMSGILGDFFVFALQPSNPVQMIFLLVNWRAEEYVVLNYAGRSYSTAQAVLIPGHIVVTYADSSEPHQQLLAVTAFNSLETHWKPLDGINLNNQLYSQNIPFLAHERLEHVALPLCDTTAYLKLSAFPSIVHGAAYKIVLYGCENKGARPSEDWLVGRVLDLMLVRPQTHETRPRAALLVYRLSPPTLLSKPWNFVLTSAISAAPALSSPRISYAGYCVNAGEREQLNLGSGTAVVDARGERAGRSTGHVRTVLRRGREEQCMRLSSSGAVMVLKGGSIAVSYWA